MPFIVFVLINLVIIGAIVSILTKRIVFSEFFNRNTPCYFLRDIEETNLTPEELATFDKKDGKLIMYNERFTLFFEGITFPSLAIGVAWPIVYYYPWNILGWCMINYVFIAYYQIIVVYLRYKLEHRPLFNKDNPHIMSYTTFPLVQNKLTLIFITVFVFFALASTSAIPKYVLAALIFKMHTYIFIDKVDALYEGDILSNESLRKIRKFDQHLIYVYLFFMFYVLDLCPLNVMIG